MASPDYLGGPMFWADGIGLAQLKARLEHYAGQRGDAFGYWAPADQLSRLAAEDRRFADLSAADLAPPGGQTASSRAFPRGRQWP